MGVEIYRDLGAHEAQITQLQADVKALRTDVAEIKALLEQTRGSVKMLMLVGSVAGAVGAIIVKVAAWLKGGV